MGYSNKIYWSEIDLISFINQRFLVQHTNQILACDTSSNSFRFSCLFGKKTMFCCFQCFRVDSVFTICQNKLFTFSRTSEVNGSPAVGVDFYLHINRRTVTPNRCMIHDQAILSFNYISISNYGVIYFVIQTTVGRSVFFLR